MCCLVWGFFCHKFCDPLIAIYKAVQQASYLHSYLLFASVFSSKLVYLYFRVPSVGHIVFLGEVFVLFKKSYKTKLWAATLKQSWYYQGSPSSPDSWIFGPWQKFSKFIVPLPNYKAEYMHPTWTMCVWQPGVVCTSIKMWNASECHGDACLIGVSIDSALKQTRQSFAGEYLRCSKQLDGKSYLSCRSMEKESKIHIKNIISYLFLYLWIVELTWY